MNRHIKLKVGLRITACSTWLAVVDVSVDEDDDDEGDERRHPADEEHDSNAENCSEQRQPLVVVLERRSPA